MRAEETDTGQWGWGPRACPRGGRGGFLERVTRELSDTGLEVNVPASGTSVLCLGGTMDLVGVMTRPETGGELRG